MNLKTAQKAAGVLVDVLGTELDLEFAVGGSVALASYGLLTRPIDDIDLVCRPPKKDNQLISAIRKQGFRMQDETIKKARQSLEVGKLRFYQQRAPENDTIKFEIFVPCRFKNLSPKAKALADATYRQTRLCPLGSGLTLVSPEVCITWKTLFARPGDEQDLFDIRDRANEQGLVLDTLFIENHIASLTGQCGPNMELLRRVFFSNTWFSGISG